MRSSVKGYLVLENGQVITGQAWGAQHEALCQWMFSTAMSGYVETVTNPAMAGQGLVMTYPLIGNYGCSREDFASDRPWVAAMVVREIAALASNFRNEITLDELLTLHDIPGLHGVDTRALVRLLRENGTMRGLLTFDAAQTIGTGLQASVERIKAYKTGSLVARVSKPGTIYHPEGKRRATVIDLGLTNGLLRRLIDMDFCVHTLPFDASPDTVLDSHPELIMFSDGPGAPQDYTVAIDTANTLSKQNVSMAGIGLGHLVIALSQGLPLHKLRVPCHGCYPIRDMQTQRVSIAAQGYEYCVTDAANAAKVTHLNITDNQIAGLQYHDKPIRTVQFQPQGRPGPLDATDWFDGLLA